MERNQYKRITNKTHRPPLNDYIHGRVKLEDLVATGKIVKSQERHNKQALLASINSIDNRAAASSNRIRYKSEKNIYNAKPCSSKSSHNSRSKYQTTKTASDSNSVCSERSAQGDTSRSNVKVFRSLSSVSKTDSVILEQQLNDREKEITKLKEELESLRNAKNADIDIVSKLQKLIDDLGINDEDSAVPTNYDILTERLCKGVQSLRICHEATQQKTHEKDTKLAQFRARVSTLESELKKCIKKSERQYRELVVLEKHNEKLRAELEASKKTYADGVGLFAELQKFIQHEFKDKLVQLQNYDRNLQARAEQLQNSFDKLEEICKRHIRWMELRPQNEIDRLKEEIRVSEVTTMQQMCEVTAELVDQGKEFKQLHKTNEQLLSETHQYKAFCTKLAIENRELKSKNDYLLRLNEALQDCRKEIEKLSPRDKLKTMATLEMKTLDAEKAYSEELFNHTEEIQRVTSRSTIE